MEANQQSYNSKKAVKLYASKKRLLEAEKRIFAKLTKRDTEKILDIGVGGGRTCSHLIPLTEEYIAIDYARDMIAQAKKQYGKYPNASFFEMDARDLSSFKVGEFTFILFSFNGIDYVSFEDRMIILTEIHRCLKKDSLFLFSTHNTRNIKHLFSYSISYNPIKSLKSVKNYYQLKAVNGSKEKYFNNDYCMIKDGENDFSTNTFYIKPELQIENLESLGFEFLNMYDGISGKEIKIKDLKNFSEPWIYFLCKKQ